MSWSSRCWSIPVPRLWRTPTLLLCVSSSPAEDKPAEGSIVSVIANHTLLHTAVFSIGFASGHRFYIGNNVANHHLRIIQKKQNELHRLRIIQVTERLHNLWRQQQQIRFLPASTTLLYSQNRWKVCSPCKFLWLSGSSVCWTIQRKPPGYSLFFCWRNSEGQKFNCHWNSQAASWSVAIRFPFTVSYVIFDYSCVTGLPYGCPRVFSEQTLERILQGQYNWVSPRKHESRLNVVVYLVIK